ncbi:MAG TPA: hypothetical protein VN756_03805 [Solirubrobacterales bacterium]|nr:hypothetical protein [Solirubrobacterales bacterium]
MTDEPKVVEVTEESPVDGLPGSKKIEKKLVEVVMKGGPLSRSPDFTIEVDGAPLKNGTKATIVADVGDAVRLTTEQVLVYADISVKAASWKKVAVADVRLRTDEDAEMVRIEGHGDTALEALKDAVRQLEPQA